MNGNVPHWFPEYLLIKIYIFLILPSNYAFYVLTKFLYLNVKLGRKHYGTITDFVAHSKYPCKKHRNHIELRVDVWAQVILILVIP